ASRCLSWTSTTLPAGTLTSTVLGSSTGGSAGIGAGSGAISGAGSASAGSGAGAAGSSFSGRTASGAGRLSAARACCSRSFTRRSRAAIFASRSARAFSRESTRGRGSATGGGGGGGCSGIRTDCGTGRSSLTWGCGVATGAGAAAGEIWASLPACSWPRPQAKLARAAAQRKAGRAIRVFRFRMVGFPSSPYNGGGPWGNFDPPLSATAGGIEADDVAFAGRRRRHRDGSRPARLLGHGSRRLLLCVRRAGLLEPEAEIGGRVGEGGEGGEGDVEPLARAAEAQQHGEGLGVDLQSPELVLEDDGDLLGILLAQEPRHLDAGVLRAESDVEVVLARQPVLGDLLQDSPHGIPQGFLKNGRIVDLVGVHFLQALRSRGAAYTPSRRIVGAGGSPGAAPQHPPRRQPAPLPGAVLADRPLAIVAAGGSEPAADAELAHVRRQRRLIEMDGAEKRAGGKLIAGRPGEVEGQEETGGQDDKPDFQPAAGCCIHPGQLSPIGSSFASVPARPCSSRPAPDPPGARRLARAEAAAVVAEGELRAAEGIALRVLLAKRGSGRLTDVALAHRGSAQAAGDRESDDTEEHREFP